MTKFVAAAALFAMSPAVWGASFSRPVVRSGPSAAGAPPVRLSIGSVALGGDFRPAGGSFKATALAPALPGPLVTPILASPMMAVAYSPALPDTKATPDHLMAGLEAAQLDGKLEVALPAFYERSLPIPGGSADAPEVSGGDVREEYRSFLIKLGFAEYSAAVAANLKTRGLAPLQKKVLKFNGRRYQVFDASRELAAEVMAGLAERRNSGPAMEAGAELAARLLSLQAIDPPSSLPADVAKRGSAGIVEWLSAVTIQRLSGQLAQVVSDVMVTITEPKELAGLLADVSDGVPDAAKTKDFARRTLAVKEHVETVLKTLYTDGEIGQTRYAGRALAAALVRYSRLNARPEIEAALKAKVADRGLRLENFVGDTLVVENADVFGKTANWKLKTGDILGERSLGREASEITFAVRPHPSLLWRAFREKVLGSPLGLIANPKVFPKPAPGLRGLPRRIWNSIRRWAAGTSALRSGYSHAGMARVQSADGVTMAWALDNYPNAEEGGIRKIGILENFAQNGPYIRFGFSRFSADKVALEFARQAAAGFQMEVYPAERGRHWKTTLPPEDHSRLAAIPKNRSAELLDELNERAAAALELMMTRLGVGFAYGFGNELWRAYCSSTLMLAHRIANQFEIQSRQDHWHLLVRGMKLLGMEGAKDQSTDGRVIWPASLFIDPKVALHKSATHPAFVEVGRLADPYSMPAYVELDPAATRALVRLLQVSGEGAIEPDGDSIDHALRTHLDSRADKNRRAKSGRRSGANRSTGYSAGLEALLEDE